MMKMPMPVAAIMPPITPVPTAMRLAAPAPLAITSGTMPRMKASEVMMIGRRRNLAASLTASSGFSPRSSSSIANSTIRMAFLAARPMMVIRPTLK